jgi:hypothetical protein
MSDTPHRVWREWVANEAGDYVAAPIAIHADRYRYENDVCLELSTDGGKTWKPFKEE